jgi:hypothetical protein
MKRAGFVWPSLLTAIVALSVAGCGGGGASPGNTVPLIVTSPTPGLPATQSTSVTAGSSSVTATFGSISSGASGFATLGGAISGSGSVNATLSSTPPSGVPAVQSLRRSPKAIGVALSTFGFFTFVPSATLQFASTPSFTLSFATVILPTGANYYVGIYDASAGWTTLLGPATSNGTSVTFPALARAMTFTAGGTYTFVVFGTSGALSTPSPAPTAAQTPVPAGLATVGPALAYMSSIGTNAFAAAVSTTANTAFIVDVSNQEITTATNAAPSLTPDGISIKVGTGSNTFATDRAPIDALGLTEQPSGGRSASATPFKIGAAREYVESPSRGTELAGFFQRAARVASRSRQSYRRAQALPATVGSTNVFQVANGALGSISSSTTSVAATLAAVSTHGYIWIDSSLSLTPQSIAAIGADYDNAYASDTTHFGSPEYTSTSPGALAVSTPCDSSGVPIPNSTPVPILIPPANGMHVVLVINSATLGANVGGYFGTLNYVTQPVANCMTGQPKSNEAPMIVVEFDTQQTLQYDLQEDLVRGTAHELQHEINFVSHYALQPVPRFEAPWINEGLSMLAQDFAVTAMFPVVPNDVDDALGRAQTFLATPSKFSLTGFTGIESGESTFTFNCSSCYGAEYLFQRYLYDRFGGDAYTHAMETSASTSYANLQAATGVVPSQLISDFVIALVNSGTGASTDPRYTFVHFNPYGRFVDQFSRTRQFAGPGVFTGRPGSTISLSAYIGTFHYVQIVSTAGQGAGLTVTDTGGAFGLVPALVQF